MSKPGFTAKDLAATTLGIDEEGLKAAGIDLKALEKALENKLHSVLDERGVNLKPPDLREPGDAAQDVLRALKAKPAILHSLLRSVLVDTERDVWIALPWVESSGGFLRMIAGVTKNNSVVSRVDRIRRRDDGSRFQWNTLGHFLENRPWGYCQEETEGMSLCDLALMEEGWILL